MNKFLTLLLSTCCMSLYSQSNKELIDISRFGDCSQARVLNTSQLFGPTTAPPGHGEVMEFFNNPQSSLYYIEEEHHSVWYKFKTIHNARLVFEIIPINYNDDYDFVLYKMDPATGCSHIVNKDILPVRTNISRNDPQIESRTGLSLQAENLYEKAGKGSSFSKALDVKKGELYYMLVDNVYEGGEGHLIVFDYINAKGKTIAPHQIRNKVIDSKTGKAIEARIIIQDKDGNIIVEGKSDPETGIYHLNLPENFEYRDEYSITVCAKGYFFSEESLDVVDALNSRKVKEVRIQKLEAGKSFRISNIYFFENSPMYVPMSTAVLDKLFKLMEQNPLMRIEIDGHINGCGADPNHIQTLSEARASTVKNYLVRKGVDRSRIETKGYGCSKMIYPQPENDEERQLNRRVEIKILKVE
jgi:outer membrane protein OmpA-like peptidoglycan-associated protein